MGERLGEGNSGPTDDGYRAIKVSHDNIGLLLKVVPGDR